MRKTFSDRSASTNTPPARNTAPRLNIFLSLFFFRSIFFLMIHLHSAGNDARETGGLLEDVCCSVGESLSGNPRSGLSRAKPPRRCRRRWRTGGGGEGGREEGGGGGGGGGEPGTSYFFLLISLHLKHGLLNACLSGLTHD